MKKIFCARPVPHLFLSSHQFHIDHNALCLPSKILYNHCFRFLLVMQNLGGNKVHYGLCENDEYFEGLVPFDWTCFCVVKWLKFTATRCKKKKLWCSESSTCRKTLKLNLLISHYVHFHLYGIYTVCFSFAFAVVVKLTVDFLRSVQSCRIRILSNLQNGIASLLLLLPPFCAL